MFAALTNAVRPSAHRRRSWCSLLELAGRGDEQADQQRALERRDQPHGPHRQALGQQQLQPDRDEHGGLRRPERLGRRRRRIGATGWFGDFGHGGQSRRAPGVIRADRAARGARDSPAAMRVGGAGRVPAALALRRMGIENPIHLLFLGVVALLVLGPKRLPELARTLGNGIREFRETISGATHRASRPHAAARRRRGLAPRGAACDRPARPRGTLHAACRCRRRHRCPAAARPRGRARGRRERGRGALPARASGAAADVR